MNNDFKVAPANFDQECQKQRKIRKGTRNENGDFRYEFVRKIPKNTTNTGTHKIWIPCGPFLWIYMPQTQTTDREVILTDRGEDEWIRIWRTLSLSRPKEMGFYREMSGANACAKTGNQKQEITRAKVRTGPYNCFWRFLVMDLFLGELLQ